MVEKTYKESVICPVGHIFTAQRRIASAGWQVSTRCRKCGKQYKMTAGPVPLAARGVRVLKESDIEARLVKRVKELGGEVRKVQWVGRIGAPDRAVMLPPRDAYGEDAPSRLIWVELKAPGKAAKFPSNAHERRQQREHERMRKMGQRVEVVDSYERIEEVLA